MSSDSAIVVPRNRQMCAMWFLGGWFCVGFAALPWFALLAQGGKLNWVAGCILTLWSSPSLLLGCYLLFMSICRIELEGSPNEIIRLKTLGPLQFEKRFDVGSVQLSRKVKMRKRPDARVLEVGSLDPKDFKLKLLLWDLECRDLHSVGRKIASAAGVNFSE